MMLYHPTGVLLAAVTAGSATSSYQLLEPGAAAWCSTGT